jgi:hypothetical protein
MKSKGTEQNWVGLIDVLSAKLRRAVNSGTADAPAPEVYEIRPREDGDGFDLISGRFQRGPIWYAGPDAVRNAIAYAKYHSWSSSRQAVIRVLDHSNGVIEAPRSEMISVSRLLSGVLHRSKHQVTTQQRRVC